MTSLTVKINLTDEGVNRLKQSAIKSSLLGIVLGAINGIATDDMNSANPQNYPELWMLLLGYGIGKHNGFGKGTFLNRFFDEGALGGFAYLAPSMIGFTSASYITRTAKQILTKLI